jgi:hypothetical protein
MKIPGNGKRKRGGEKRNKCRLGEAEKGDSGELLLRREQSNSRGRSIWINGT